MIAEGKRPWRRCKHSTTTNQHPLEINDKDICVKMLKVTPLSRAAAAAPHKPNGKGQHEWMGQSGRVGRWKLIANLLLATCCCYWADLSATYSAEDSQTRYPASGVIQSRRHSASQSSGTGQLQSDQRVRIAETKDSSNSSAANPQEDDFQHSIGAPTIPDHIDYRPLSLACPWGPQLPCKRLHKSQIRFFEWAHTNLADYYVKSRSWLGNSYCPPCSRPLRTHWHSF